MVLPALRKKKHDAVRIGAKMLRTQERDQRTRDRVARSLAAELQERQVPADQIFPPADLVAQNQPDPLPIDHIQDGAARNAMLLQLKASAKLAYDLEALEDKYATALASMHEMKGVIDENQPVILNMQFTDIQIQELFKRYCAAPKKSVTKEHSMRLMDQVVKLNKKITPTIAEQFKEWSDRFPDQQVNLTSLVDAGAVFTLNNAIFQGREKLAISEEEARNWLTRWDHTQLVTALIKLWNSDTDNSQFLTINQTMEKFKMLSGEQEKLSELHTITEKFGTSETSLPEQQQILFNQLMKNMLAQNKNNPYFLAMQTYFANKTMPNRTINDWVACFLKVRTEARKALATCEYFGATSLHEPKIKRHDKNKEKAERNNSNDKIGQNNQEKSEKKKEKYQKLRERYDDTMYKRYEPDITELQLLRVQATTADTYKTGANHFRTFLHEQGVTMLDLLNASPEALHHTASCFVTYLSFLTARGGANPIDSKVINSYMSHVVFYLVNSGVINSADDFRCPCTGRLIAAIRRRDATLHRPLRETISIALSLPLLQSCIDSAIQEFPDPMVTAFVTAALYIGYIFSLRPCGTIPVNDT